MGYRVFLFLHRWTGIAAAALIVVIGLTGSIIIFRASLDRRLNADILDVVPRGQQLDVDTLLARVQASAPGTLVNAVVPSADPTRAWTLLLAERGHSVHVNPYTGEITGKRSRAEAGLDRRGFVPLMYGIHHDLLLEAPGHWVVAGTGLAWLILSLIGVYLSLKQSGGLRAAFRVRLDAGLKRAFVDLHRSFGMATVVLVAVMCVSGIYLGLKQDVSKLVSVFSPVTPAPERALPANPVANAPIGFGRALEAAAAALPGAQAHSIFAVRAKGVYRVRLVSAGDRSYRGDRFVYVSMQDGAVAQVRDVKRGTAGDVFVGWQLPLHTGEAFGPPGQAIAFILGLFPLLFSITGIYLWLKNRRRGRRTLLVQTRQQPSGSQRSAASTHP